MEDNQIIKLYFDRSEQAIKETDTKYGGYCYSIAYKISLSGGWPPAAPMGNGAFFSRNGWEIPVFSTFRAVFSAIRAIQLAIDPKDAV